MKVNSLKRNNPSYPSVLEVIEDAPREIFYLGAKPETWLNKPRLAVVGSRKVSAYGRQVTEQLVGELARLGIVIVSGLALGVDSIAHKAALDNKGPTVAVLPTDLANIYPPSHANLARQIIASGGTLLSEYSAGSPVYKVQFTARNRIVSGLSDAVLITEAAARSGTMNTARFALEQGKTVLAVPGNITSPTSEGTNNLIKSGAVPVTSVEDILFAMNLSPKKLRKQRAFAGSSEEEEMLELIKSGVSSQEELALSLKIDGAEIASLLTMLEINGFIKPAGGGYWLAV